MGVLLKLSLGVNIIKALDNMLMLAPTIILPTAPLATTKLAVLPLAAAGAECLCTPARLPPLLQVTEMANNGIFTMTAIWLLMSWALLRGGDP